MLCNMYNTWLFKGRLEVTSMDYVDLVYKIDRLSYTEFSIEFSYINPIQGSSY